MLICVSSKANDFFTLFLTTAILGSKKCGTVFNALTWTFHSVHPFSYGAMGLELIPAVIGREVVYALDRSPLYCRGNT